METSQLTNSKIEEVEKPSKPSYFQQGLSYLISGTNQCFSEMEECDMESPEEMDKVIKMIDLLKNKIDTFSQSHLKISNQAGSGPVKQEGTQEEAQTENQEGLFSELSLLRRKNKALMRANLRLKRENRQLRVRSDYIRNGLALQVELAASKYHQKIQSLVSDLKKSLPNKPKKRESPKKQKKKTEKNQISTKDSVQTTTLSSSARPPLAAPTPNNKPSSLVNLPQNISNKSVQIPARFENQDQLDLEVPLIREFKSELDLELSLIKGLQSQLDVLHQDHLRLRDRFKINQLGIDIREVANHRDGDGLIGLYITLLAFKNKRSCMIVTTKNGIKVIEDDQEVYLAYLPQHERAYLRDVIYIKHLNCYLLSINQKLYRKDIDGNEPYIYMELTLGFRIGSFFKYSNLNQRLIIHKDNTNLSVVNLESKEIEIEVEKEIGTQIIDSEIFGEEENRVLSVTDDVYLLVYKLNYQEKVGSIINHLEVGLLRTWDEHEHPVQLSICPRGNYALIQLYRGEITNYQCSRFLLIKISENSLVIDRSIDSLKSGVRFCFASECFGYVGSHLIWVGLSYKESQLQILDFDTVTGEFRNLDDKKIAHGESLPLKLQRFENDYYYTGNSARVMRLSFKI